MLRLIRPALPMDMVAALRTATAPSQVLPAGRRLLNGRDAVAKTEGQNVRPRLKLASTLATRPARLDVLRRPAASLLASAARRPRRVVKGKGRKAAARRRPTLAGPRPLFRLRQQYATWLAPRPDSLAVQLGLRKRPVDGACCLLALAVMRVGPGLRLPAISVGAIFAVLSELTPLACGLWLAPLAHHPYASGNNFLCDAL